MLQAAIPDVRGDVKLSAKKAALTIVVGVAKQDVKNTARIPAKEHRRLIPNDFDRGAISPI